MSFVHFNQVENKKKGDELRKMMEMKEIVTTKKKNKTKNLHNCGKNHIQIMLGDRRVNQIDIEEKKGISQEMMR